jgi:hypothetical protein
MNLRRDCCGLPGPGRAEGIDAHAVNTMQRCNEASDAIGPIGSSLIAPRRVMRGVMEGRVQLEDPVVKSSAPEPLSSHAIVSMLRAFPEQLPPQP